MINNALFLSVHRFILLSLFFMLFHSLPVSIMAQPMATVTADAVWQEVNNNSASGFQARHEGGYVAINGKFYLVGGRGNRVLNVFDPVTREWSEAATVPNNNELHHFQAVSFQNKLYLIGAFTGGFPEEKPVGDIYIYDPLTNEWEVRVDAIPVERRRGAAGAVVYNNHIYLVAGIRNGHTDGWVKWFDRYNPATGVWEILPDAPHERDHFQAVVLNNKLYAIAGRKTGFTSLLGDTESAIDIYNFETGLWETTAAETNIPTPRAGAAAIAIEGKIMVAGGESGSNGAHNEVELFDPLNYSWSALPALNTGRHGIQAVLNNGTVYIAAGWGYIGAEGGELLTQESLDFTTASPTKGPAILKPLPDLSLTTDSIPQVIELAGYFKSSDGEGLNYSVSFVPSNPILASGEIEGSALKLSFHKGRAGTAVIKIRATDSAGLFIEDVFNITIRPVPLSAPKIVSPIADKKIPFNTSLVKIYLGNIFSDEKGSINLVYSLPNITNKNIIESAEILNDTLFLNFKLNAIGRTAIYVKATDGDNLSVTDAFLVEFVSGTALKPSVKSPLNDLQLFKNSSPVRIGLNNVFATINSGTSFSYSLKNSNSNLMAAGIISDSLYLNVSPDSIGTATIVVTATDPSGYFAEDEFKVNVVKRNGSPLFTMRINSGGGSVAFNGEKWLADTFYKAGNSYAADAGILGTEKQALYQTERHGDFSYAIPVPNGKFNVRLHFAEIYFTSPRQRVFNVGVEEMTALIDSFDIFSASGGEFMAYIKQIDSVDVADGFLDIQFSSIQNFAKISAIEVMSVETNKINYPPFVSFPVPDQEMKYEDSTRLVNLYKVFSDDLGSVPLKLSIADISDSSLLGSAIISGLTLTLKKGPLQSGITTIRVRATDNLGQFAEDEFLLTIKEPSPSKPVVTRPLADLNEKINVLIPAIDIKKTFTDNRGVDQLAYSARWIGNESLIRNILIKEGLLNIVLNKNVYGSSNITVRATDRDGLFAEDEFVINIINTDTSSLKAILINAGGDAILGEPLQWQADQWYEGGRSYTYTFYSPVTGDSILSTERFGNFTYKIPLSKGTYKVKLHFAELFWQRKGNRVFNVDIENGQGILNEYDIIDKAGAPSVRIVEEFSGVSVEDGFLDIAFATLTDNAKISGIEIIPEPAATATNRRNAITGTFSEAGQKFRVYPNPLSGSLVYLDIPDQFIGAEATLSVVNMQGAVVYSRTGIKNNLKRVPIQLPPSLTKGTYMVILRKQSDTETLKLIIQ